MILREINDILLGRFQSLDKTNQETRDKGVFAINTAIASVWRAANWSFKKKLGQLVLIPRYTTGQSSFTKFDGTNETQSKKVDFSGSVLTQSMVGRFFRPQKSFNWYKIVAISGNSAFLDTPIVDDSKSGVPFEIWKRFYYLKSEVDIILDGFNWNRNSFIDVRNDTRISYEGKNIGDEGNPIFMGSYGVDPYDDIVYSDGTISIPSKSNIVTGSGTSFLGNVNTGEILNINNVEYYIKRVESDTTIILYNYSISEVSAGSSYKIRKNNPIGLQFYFSSDSYRLIDYTYLSKPYELKNEDKDLFPMDFDYLKAVLDRAESVILKDIDKSGKWNEVLSLAESEIQSLKNKKDVIRPRYNQFNPTIPAFMPGRF